MLTSAQLSILQHSLGLDGHGRGKAYRNHFNVDGGPDQVTCEQLVDAGMMVRRDQRIWTGATFIVTTAGEAAVRTQSPSPPKRSRSAERYQRYLDSFGDWESFSDYLKFGHYRQGWDQ